MPNQHSSHPYQQPYLKKLNRIKSQATKKQKFWCGCDRSIVGTVGKDRKCSECGRKVDEGRNIPLITE